MSAATQETAQDRLGMRVVGPAFGPDTGTDQSEQWEGVRQTIARLAKRMNIPSDEERVPAPRVRGRTKIAKQDREPPAASAEDDDLEGATQTDFIDDVMIPPFDLEALCMLYENSGALRRNIDAMVTNVDGFGQRFEPVLDFSSPDINDQIRDIKLREELEGIDDLLEVSAATLESKAPSLEEVESTKNLWSMLANVEKGRLESFFAFVNPLTTFTKLRKSTRQDMELLGNAGWEVIRKNNEDPTSKITDIYHVPFVNVRLIRADSKPTLVKVRIRKDPIHYDEVEVYRHFRRYVRIVGSTRTYYKDFGDERIVSRTTGRYYTSIGDLQEEEGSGAKPAHELFHWQIRSPKSAYGVPRWMGELIAVLGNRASEEVNLLYFDNKAIPPMVLLVSGGRVSESSVERIASYIEDRVRGRQNFHKILILEAVPAGEDVDSGDLEHSGRMRIELKPLMKELPQDALFQTYDSNNQIKIGRAFRLPQILTGDHRDQNRATAEVSKAMAEEQVFQPERDDFDSVINRHFLPSLLIHFWCFRTQAPVQRFPDSLIENVRKSLMSGSITPNEARKLIADAFSIDLPFRNEDWAKSPPNVILTAMKSGGVAGPEAMEGNQIEAQGGDVVARGSTSKDNDHTHKFVAVRSGEEIRIEISPGGDDDHTHAVEPIAHTPGESVEVRTAEENDHAHTVSFTMAGMEKRQRMSQAALALFALRNAIREEMEIEKDEWLEAARETWYEDAQPTSSN